MERGNVRGWRSDYSTLLYSQLCLLVMQVFVEWGGKGRGSEGWFDKEVVIF